MGFGGIMECGWYGVAGIISGILGGMGIRCGGFSDAEGCGGVF